MRVLRDFKKLIVENTSLAENQITLKQIGHQSKTGLEVGLIRNGSAGYSNFATLGANELIRQEVMLQILIESKDSDRISDVYEEIAQKLGVIHDYECDNYIFRYLQHISGPITLVFNKEGKEIVSTNFKAVIDRKRSTEV